MGCYLPKTYQYQPWQVLGHSPEIYLALCKDDERWILAFS